VKVGVCLAGATAATAIITVAATVTDYQSGHVRTADEFASQLATGTVLGAVTGATLYGLWYAIPGASILMGADLAGLFASSSPVAAVVFSKAAALAGYFLMGSQVIRYASEISSLGTGYNWMLEQLFGGDAVTYSDATTLMDALAAYTVIVGWENMPEKLKESRENLIKYGKMDTSLIGEGTGEPPVQGDPDFIGPLTSKDFGRLEIISGKEPFSQTEINAARYMAEQGHDVVLRPPVGTRLDGGTSDLLVNGINYDVYTPKTSNVSRIVGGIASKNSQTTGVVLDLSQTSATADDFANVLQRVQGSIRAGGKEVNITDIVIMPK